jgi:hypothetical protein
MIDKHAMIGLQSPVLAYDPATFLWFADFNRIGTAKCKAHYDEVLQVIKATYDVFDLKKHVSQYAYNAAKNIAALAVSTNLLSSAKELSKVA